MNREYNEYTITNETSCPSFFEPLVFQMNKSIFDKYQYLSIVNFEQVRKTFTVIMKTEIFLSVSVQQQILTMFSQYIELYKDFLIEEVFDKHESGAEFYLELLIMNDKSMVIFNEQVKINS